jgi:tetratricopeptide (TPR) repeat protein
VVELSDDIRRFLEGRPVHAHPQTSLYQTSKFLRRRWPAVVAAAVFVLGLSTATIFAWHQARAAKSEARIAKDEAQKSAHVTQFLRRMLNIAYRSGGVDVTVLQMLNASEPTIEKSWKGDPLAEASLRESLGASYTTLEQPDRAKRQLNRALTLFRSLGRDSDAADTLLVLGILEQGADGRIFTAAQDYQQALDALRSAGKQSPAGLTFRLKVYLAGVLISGYRLEEAQAALNDAFRLAARDSTIPPELLPAAWTHQGEVLLEQGRFPEAEALFHRAIAADRYGSDAWVDLARSSWLQQNFAGAAKLAREDYQTQFDYNHEHLSDTAEAEVAWARYRSEAGEAKPAVAQIQAALPSLRRDYLAGYMLAFYLEAAARVFNNAGRSEEAAQYARESLTACRQAELPELHPMVAAANEDLGRALAAMQRYGTAVPALRKALQTYRRLSPIYGPAGNRVEGLLHRLRADGR